MSVQTNVGTYRQSAALFAPTAPVADGDGGFTQTYVALDPAGWRCSIERASVSSAERTFAQTVIAQATHVLRGRYHSGITVATRVQWTDRAGAAHVADAIDVVDVEGAGVESAIAVAEVLNADPPINTGWVQGGWIQ